MIKELQGTITLIDVFLSVRPNKDKGNCARNNKFG